MMRTLKEPITLSTNGLFAQKDAGWQSSGVTTDVVPATAGARGVGNALRVSVQVKPDSYPWSHTVRQVLTVGTIKTGDLLCFRAFLRSPERMGIGVYIEGNKTFDKQLQRVVKLTPEWQEFRIIGKAIADFAPGEASLVFHCGTGNGIIEMTDIRVEDYGDSPTASLTESLGSVYTRPKTDAWRGEAEARIKQIRQGDAMFNVRDKQGKPVPGATVRVEQQRHHFRWGTAVLTPYILGNRPDDVRLRTELKRLFNTAVFGLELKWHWQDNDPDRVAKALAAAKWLHRNGFDIRGHTLIWGSYQFSPRMLKGKDPSTIRQLMEAHIDSDMSAMRGQLYIWDVVNEAVTERDLWETVGWDMFPRCYELARRIEPRVQRCYNENTLQNDDGGTTWERVKTRLSQLMKANAPFDVIGDQAHMGVPLIPMAQVLATWDKIHAFTGRKLEVTEFDISVRDDILHADYFHDFLTAAFSHPAMQSFIQWGFWEGDHWKAAEGGAIFRKDWSPRPSVKVYEDLVLKKWWSRERVVSGRDGLAKSRLFYGTHQVLVSRSGKPESTFKVSVVPGAKNRFELVV